MLDHRLKSIQPRMQWGCQPDSICLVDDNEFLMSIGTRIIICDDEVGHNGTKIMIPQIPEVRTIISVVVSDDYKFAATPVRFAKSSYKASIVIYDIESQKTYPKRPKIIQYEDELVRSHDMHFVNAAFSGDSVLLACNTNNPTVGILIYDWLRDKLLRQIAVKHPLTKVSFNPKNNTKICATGESNLFQFWHYTAKATHPAPIEGLQKGDHIYTCHAWIGNDRVLGGTNTGYICLIQGCEQKQLLQAFENTPTNNTGMMRIHVSGILVKGDSVVVYSSAGFVAVYQMKRLEGTGGHGPTVSLVNLLNLKLHNTEAITSLYWCHKSVSSLVIIVASPVSLRIFDLKAKDKIRFEATATATEDPLGTIEEENNKETPNQFQYTSKVRPSTSTGNTPSIQHQKSEIKTLMDSYLSADNMPHATQVFLFPDRTIMSFHGGYIHSLAISSRISTFISASVQDATLNVWDTSAISGTSVIQERYLDRLSESPASVDLHPSGRYITFGCENFAAEYAVTDSKLEMVRKVPIKEAITSPGGEPFMNLSSVSLVRYSHGGHLLAVVTGRLAQLFHLFNLEYSGAEKTGTPSRVMVLTDHSVMITDLVFSADDNRLYTSSADGTVYEWEVGSYTRSSDFVRKGIPVTRLAASPKKTIIACYELEADIHVLNRKNKKRNSLNQQVQGVENAVTNINTASKGLGQLTSTLNDSTIGGGIGDELLHIRRSISTDPLGLTGKGTAAATDSKLTALNTSWGAGGNVTVNGDSAIMSGNNTSNGSSKGKSFLALWQDHVGQVARIIDVTVAVTAIAFGVWEGRDKDEMCVLGLADGTVLVCNLPLPTLIVSVGITNMAVNFERTNNNNNNTTNYSTGNIEEETIDSKSKVSGTTSTKGNNIKGMTTAASPKDQPVRRYSNSDNHHITSSTSVHQEALDESRCKSLMLHEGPVSRLCVSQSGHYIFSSGSDGSLFMLSTLPKTTEMSEAAESLSPENNIIQTGRLELKSQKTRIDDLEMSVEDMKREKERLLVQTKEAQVVLTKDLEATRKREVDKRDKIIISGRDDHSRQIKELLNEMESNKLIHEREMAELELSYERRIAQESLYFNRMRQAYDEFVAHARLDLVDAHKAAEQKLKMVQNEKLDLVVDTEKQKEIVVQYCQYIAERHAEVMHSLEEAQFKERLEFKEHQSAAEKSIEMAKDQSRSEMGQLVRKMNIMKQETGMKELEALERQQELEKAKDKVQRLETALQTAMKEIDKKDELAGWWETKAGEQQQQISELERVRRALTSQLHALRQDLGPKEEKLARTTERLQEVDREYEMSLNAISKKDQLLEQRGAKAFIFQKQVMELQEKFTKSETSLRRAARLLYEYQEALQKSQFNSKKVPAASLSASSTQPPPLVPGTATTLGTSTSAAITALITSSNNQNTPPTSLTTDKRPLSAIFGHGTGAGPNNVTGKILARRESQDIYPKKGVSPLSALIADNKANSSLQLASGSHAENLEKTGMVQMIVKTAEMETALNKMQELLDPYTVGGDNERRKHTKGDKKQLISANDDDGREIDTGYAVQEQEKRLKVMYNHTRSLQNIVDQNNDAVDGKVLQHIAQNEIMLNEINELRLYIHKIEKENDRLKAEAISSSEKRTERIKTFKSVAPISASYFNPKGSMTMTEPSTESLREHRQLFEQLMRGSAYDVTGSIDSDHLEAGLSHAHRNSPIRHPFKALSTDIPVAAVRPGAGSGPPTVQPLHSFTDSTEGDLADLTEGQLQDEKLREEEQDTISNEDSRSVPASRGTAGIKISHLIDMNDKLIQSMKQGVQTPGDILNSHALAPSASTKNISFHDPLNYGSSPAVPSKSKKMKIKDTPLSTNNAFAYTAPAKRLQFDENKIILSKYPETTKSTPNLLINSSVGGKKKKLPSLNGQAILK